jgi:N-acetylmuramoyl-L-alanine amidase
MKTIFGYLILLFVISVALSLPLRLKASINNETGKITTIVIDPGHGGKDPGAVGVNVREKDIVLDISIKLGNLIRKNFPEVKVIYTRKTDVFIPLNERALVANKNNADLFISIHANSVDNKSVKGTETFTLGLHRSQENLEVAKKENSVILLEDNYETTYEGFDPNQAESYIMFENIQEVYSEQSILFASETQDQYREIARRPDRSVKQAGLIVLRQAAMPSVLTEVGFISNEQERNYLLSEKGKSEIALALFQAFKNFKRRTENKSSFQSGAESLAEKTTQTDSEIQPPKAQALEKESTDIQSVSAAERIITEVNSESIQNKKKGFFSVQIAAISKKIEPTPSNFKGEKNIYLLKIGPYYKFYSGKLMTESEANTERKRLAIKFPGAFIVFNNNGNITPLK